MFRKLSVRLPIDMYEDLRDEALKYCISITDVVREKLFRYQNPNLYPPQATAEVSNLQEQILELSTRLSKKENESNENRLTITEILFLLREFLFERNAQILKKVDERMDKRFGNDRKKFV